MKLQIVVIAVAFGFCSVAEATFKGWEPAEFQVSEEPGRAAIAELQARQDIALKQISVTDPDFAKLFPKNFSRFATIALQSVVGPWTLKGYRRARTSEVVSYSFGKTIKNLQIFALNNAGLESAKNVDSTQASQLPFRYCETHPNDSWCAYGESNGLQWSVLRRLVSSAQFIKNACPVIKSYMAWDLQWKIGSQEEREATEKFFAETQRMLDFIYGDGTWSTNRIDSFQTEFDYSFFNTLVRRYLDGGPEFIDETRNCLYEFLNENDLYDSLPIDARATQGIGQLLQFRKEVVEGVELEMNSTSVDYSTYYKLTHHWDAGRALPLDIYVPDENLSYPYQEYLDTLFSNRILLPNLSRVLWQMSTMDPSYKYRTITRQEFSAMLNAGQLPRNFERVCIAEGTVEGNDEKFYEGLPDGTIDEDGWTCDPIAVKIVREVD